MARKNDIEDEAKDEEKYESQDAADLEEQANPRNYEDDLSQENIAPAVILQKPKHSMLAQLEDVGLYGRKSFKPLERTSVAKSVKGKSLAKSITKKPLAKPKSPLKKKKKK